MASQPASDAPFGLDPKLAAFLGTFINPIGSAIMFFGGGTNRFVRWASAQALTLFIVAVVAWIALFIVSVMLHIIPVIGFAITMLLYFVTWVGLAVAWLWSWIAALQGNDVRLPLVGDLTDKIFGSQLQTS